MSSSQGRWLALTSSVGRRTLSAFIIATMVPAILIASLANYTYLENNNEQTDLQLKHDSRSLGLILLRQLKTASEILASLQNISIDSESMDERNRPPIFQKLEIRKLATNNSTARPRVLIDSSQSSGEPKIGIAVPVQNTRSAETEFLIGWLTPEYIWSTGDLIGDNRNACIFAQNGLKLFCTGTNVPPISTESVKLDHASSGTFQWETDADTWKTSFWELFLASQFDSKSWVITQTMAISSGGLWGMLSGSYYLSILIILILLPLFVATIQIRKTMQPIDNLVAGIRRIARHDHSRQIEETGPAEFAQLASSINTMSSKISGQINTLHSFSEIDRVLLSKKDLGSVCQLLIQLLIKQKNINQALVILLNNQEYKHVSVYKNTAGTMIIDNTELDITERDIRNLKKIDGPEKTGIDCLPLDIRLFLEPDNRVEVFPVILKNTPRALLAISSDFDQFGSSSSELVEGALDRLALSLATIERDQKLEFQANRDELTQLANKHLLGEHLSQSMENPRDGASGALLYIDLDFFKSVNDISGHLAGDRVLAIVGQRIKRIFSADTTVARIGGDEFAVLLTHMKNETRVAEAADEIVHALSRPITLSDIEHQLDASVGIARLPEDGETLEELLFKADLAMYEAKKAGRNTWKYYQPKMKETVQARVSFEAEMRRAVECEEFSLYFQPQMNIRTGKVTSGEALVRWFHNDRGPIAPSDFIPIAEETGLIVPLGEWILSESARILKQWREDRLPIEKIAVNVSLRQFMHMDFKRMLQHAIQLSGEYSSALEIEITETMFASDAAKAIEICKWIKDRGLSIAIDDFGTGYSSLGYLNILPFDTLKIDRIFIEKIDQDPPRHQHHRNDPEPRQADVKNRCRGGYFLTGPFAIPARTSLPPDTGIPARTAGQTRGICGISR